MNEELQQILSRVSQQYKVSIAELIGRCWKSHITYARHVAIYEMRMLTNATLEQCGTILGGRTPAAVLYGFQMIARYKELSRRTSNAKRC